MTEKVKETPAKLSRERKFSTIWLVPIVALLIGIWMVYYHWASQGPLIEVSFVTAQGIEAGQTKVKMKNVDIGEVLEARLSEDTQGVAVSIRIERDATHLLREGTKFWVVRPRIGTQGVSGLNTLLSGAYIELSPGGSGKSVRRFEGLEAPPVTPVGTAGLHITLDSSGDRALSEGDPILFHGMQVGRIEYVHFNSQERRSYYNAFVEAPYDKLITTNTRFWLNSGIDFDLSADGIRVHLGTLETIISGGVSFDVPEDHPKGSVITERAFFTIYPRKNAIREKQYEHALRYVILFDDSIRGLRPGAPVEYRGIKVGSVIRTDTEFPEIGNLLEPGSQIPVVIEIEPARLGFADTELVLPNVTERIDELIANGLRGGLATGSWITGRKFVELRYWEGAARDAQTFNDYTVIPATSGQFGRLLDRVDSTLATINRLPLGKLADSARTALDEFATTLVELDEILADSESHKLMGTINQTLDKFQDLAADFSEGSITHRELQTTLRSLEETLQELEPVLRQLRRRPNSLIFGGDDEEDIEPKGNRE